LPELEVANFFLAGDEFFPEFGDGLLVLILAEREGLVGGGELVNGDVLAHHGLAGLLVPVGVGLLLGLLGGCGLLDQFVNHPFECLFLPLDCAELCFLFLEGLLEEEGLEFGGLGVEF
jgi:hypothetical protein